ncbi:MAG TPA: dihydrofolate reductase [Eubacteriales bacterium]|nr:dihydrofolate reductase [Eubacteriales bacterium]
MKAIVAVDKFWGIGKNNDLLFKLPLDMKRFRAITTGKTVVMGANTLASFPNGKPLPNRTNIVLCPEYDLCDGVIQAKSLESLFNEIAKHDDVFVIGGARMYRTLLPYCEEVLVTKVDADGGAEVFFENLDHLPNWECIESSEKVIDNGFSTSYNTYKNNDVKKFE